jgi:hypothetical protein
MVASWVRTAVMSLSGTIWNSCRMPRPSAAHETAEPTSSPLPDNLISGAPVMLSPTQKSIPLHSRHGFTRDNDLMMRQHRR